MLVRNLYLLLFFGFDLLGLCAFQIASTKLKTMTGSKTLAGNRQDRQSIYAISSSSHDGTIPLTMATLETSESPASQVEEDLLFDDQVWEAYESDVLEVLQSKRVLKKDKLENLKNAKNILLSTKCLSNLPSPLSSEGSEDFKGNFNLQREKYMDHYNLSQAEYNYIMRCLVYMGDHCAKQQKSLGIMVAWQKLKEAGILPRENSISTYMYILGSEEICGDTLIEVATFHDIFFSPNEKTTTLRIKHLIGKKQAKEAEEILLSLDNERDESGWKKLRTFWPILEHYCTVGDSKSILRIFRQMRQSSGVFFDADTYAATLGSLAKNGHFRADSLPIDGASIAGFKASHGPSLFDEIASEMAEDILELTEPAAKNIFDSFLKGFPEVLAGETDNQTEIPILPSRNESTSNVSTGLTIGRVEINASTALCATTGAKLRLIALDEDQRQHVHDTLIKMAGIQYLEFTKKRKKPVDEDLGLKELGLFSEWLDSREDDPFTVVVDGPNVGFYGYGEFHYSQVQSVVKELERMGEKPLVTMPRKYVESSFKLRYGGRQYFSKEDIQVIENLQEEGKMYVVPPLCLDDYYWMLASVSKQTSATQPVGLQVDTGDKEGRFPGLRPMLVTNDQMRDHKLDLLKPREFRRWCSCHIVNYNVPKIVKEEWEDRPVQFSPADFFSREIQGNTHDIGDGLVWHFPVTGWDEPSRFCLLIPQ